MASITQTQQAATLENPQFELDAAGWLRRNVFSSVWKTLFALLLIAANILIVRALYNADPIRLSPHLVLDGQPTGLGASILAVTNASFLTVLIASLWLLGLVTVITAPLPAAGLAQPIGLKKNFIPAFLVR